ncbi:hypothetical protein [Bacillus cereus]|nr:hypothetical protein [Bacillus cereus]
MNSNRADYPLQEIGFFYIKDRLVYEKRFLLAALYRYQVEIL